MVLVLFHFFFLILLSALKKATQFEKPKGKPGHLWPKHKTVQCRSAAAKLDLPKLANKLIIKRRYSARPSTIIYF